MKVSLLVRLLGTLGLGVLLAGTSMAQTFTVLHTFSGADGARPVAGLIASSNILYGTTVNGGSWNGGTVFRLNCDGSGFTTLYNFSGSDGAHPAGELILLGDTLYGTTQGGGDTSGYGYGYGTVFAINTDGSGFTTLYEFSGGDGQDPHARLAAGGDTLYGTTQFGGVQGKGTAFAINANGSGFTTLHDFSGDEDGAAPGGLTLSGNRLYGTALMGGSGTPGNGTVFAVSTDGSAFTAVHTFTNSEGGNPSGTLLVSESTLYGTTYLGGASGWGTVFALAGGVLTTLHSFSSGSEGFLRAGVILSGDTLYGTTEGNVNGYDSGIAFSLRIDGTHFTILHSFTASNGGPTNSDGLGPIGGLFLTGNTLYGTAVEGGSAGYGTIFSISLPVPLPQLKITPAGANVLFNWPTNLPGFTLQSSSDLNASANWVDSTNTPVAADDQYIVTNAISSLARFYRLHKMKANAPAL